MSNYIEELRHAIREAHGTAAMWVQSVPVKEVFRGETAWEGSVEVFEVSGHHKAKQCYAWGTRRDDNKGWDVTAVLAIPPITSPELAVKAAIVAHARQAKPQQ